MADTASWWRDLPHVLHPKTTTFDDLPTDLAVDILSRLPVKTLIQSTSVSNRWYSLIKNPSLITSHLARSIANPISNRYILIAPKSLSEHSRCEVFCDDEALARHSTPKIPFQTRSGTVRIVGSCNGLICLTDDLEPYTGRDVYLFNPSVQKYRKLSAEFSCYADWLENIYASLAVIGFGFYEPENDYRVVRIIYSEHDMFPNLRAGVEVYSLNSGKWRNVMAKIDHLAFGGCCAFVDGCLHWLVGTGVTIGFCLSAARRVCEKIERVMSFDLKNELVHEVEMPKGYDDDCLDDFFPVNIMNWNGSVGLCVSKPAEYRWQFLKCCYWVMKKNDDDAEVSWKKQFDLVMENEPNGMAVGVGWSGKLVIDAIDEEKWTKISALNPDDLEPEEWARMKISVLNLDDLMSKDLAFDGPYTVDSRFMESLVLLVE